MPDNYKTFFEKLGEIEVTVKETEHAGVELPLPVAKELYYGVFSYLRADKEVFNENEEKASEELQEAVNHVCQASFYALKFRFLFYLKFVRFFIEELKEHEKLASKYVLTYDEQSKNFPEIIDLIENTGLPREDSPKSQATCEDVIKKLQAFLSNFKTDKGELFTMIDTEPKTYAREGANSYNELKCELFENFNEAETRIKRFESKDVEFPLPVARDLYYGITSYIKADKELSQGNEEGAVNEMREAVYRSRWAFFDAAKLSILDYLRLACSAWELLIKHERYVDNYIKHTKNLGAIREIIENKKFPDEEPEEKQAVPCEDKLREFLEDFRKGNFGFSNARNREQSFRNKAQEFPKREKETIKKSQEAGEKNQKSRGNGFWRRLWEGVLTNVVARIVWILVLIALLCFGAYFWGKETTFWKLIPFLKP